MIVLLTIFQYFLQTVTDVADKFLISKRKIRPFNYTFYTIVTGVGLLVIWPWVYRATPLHYILLSLISGAAFSLAMYMFYMALAEGEVSRVVPFVYGIVPLFDVLIGVLFQKNFLKVSEMAALFLLIPGALLMGYRNGTLFTSHVGKKITAAFFLSVYYALWHAASSGQPVLNNLMWNRIGAAAVLIPFLLVPSLKKEVLTADEVEQKKNTAIIFLAKQALGGGTFVFLSYLLAVGKVPVINALQGFRYVFLFVTALLLSRQYRHIIDEDLNTSIIRQKFVAVALMFLGTVILFL